MQEATKHFRHVRAKLVAMGEPVQGLRKDPAVSSPRLLTRMGFQLLSQLPTLKLSAILCLGLRMKRAEKKAKLQQIFDQHRKVSGGDMYPLMRLLLPQLHRDAEKRGFRTGLKEAALAAVSVSLSPPSL